MLIFSENMKKERMDVLYLAFKQKWKEVIFYKAQKTGFCPSQDLGHQLCTNYNAVLGSLPRKFHNHSHPTAQDDREDPPL